MSNIDINDKGEYYTWYRASGSCVCPICNQEYLGHPYDPDVLSWNGYPFLHILCNGDRVKL